MENQKLTPEIIDELKAEHGEISQIDGIEHDVVIKAPSRQQYTRFMEAAQEPKRRDKAQDTLLIDCVVFPDASAFASLLDEKPGYRETVTSVVLEVAGIAREARAKKL
jgi:hypothetical protein